jgi:hypothetical protein
MKKRRSKENPTPLPETPKPKGNIIILQIFSDGRFVISGKREDGQALLDKLSHSQLDIKIEGISWCG